MKMPEIIKRSWKLIGLAILCLAAIAVICVLWQSYAGLRADYVGLQTNYGNLETDYGKLQTTYGKLEADYGKLQADYGDLLQDKGSLEAALAVAQTELSQANKAYSPRYFNSVDELKAWVKSHYPTSFPKGSLIDASLAIQKEALADGYIWSVFIEPNTMATMRYDIISCVVAGDFICYVSHNGTVDSYDKKFLMR